MSDLGILRDIRDEELELMLAWRNDPKVRANMYTRHPISTEEHASWWERTRNRSDQRYFMYEHKGVATGIAAFNGIDRSNGNSAWAFYASPAAPKGTGSRMEYLMLEEAFGKMGLQKLYCEVLAFNEPVVALHKKFGFLVEGIFRRHHCVDGEYVDIYRLGLLAEEWKKNRPTLFEKLSGYGRA